MPRVSRLATAALSLSALAACEPAANDYDTFIDKCLPVAQMQEQPGTATNLMSAQNAAEACEVELLISALQIWRDDDAVFLPVGEIDKRLRRFGV